MDALKEAGKLVTSIGSRAWLMIMGVIFPGLLVTCELIWLYLSWSFPGQPLLSLVMAVLGKLEPLVAFVFVVLVLAVSCTVGYLNRDGSFAVSNMWLRAGWPPSRDLKSLFKRLRLIYGKDAVDQVLTNHGVFNLVDASQDIVSTLPRLPESYIREYCKLWLSAKRPGLSTQSAEIEINIVIGLVTPTALAAVVFFASLHDALGIALGVLSLLSACFLLYRINAARIMETENALVNFMFAHWEESTAPIGPASAASCSDKENE